MTPASGKFIACRGGERIEVRVALVRRWRAREAADSIGPGRMAAPLDGEATL